MSDILYPLPNNNTYYIFSIGRIGRRYEAGRLARIHFELATNGGLPERILNNVFLNRMPQKDIESFKVQLEEMGLELPEKFTKRLDEMKQATQAAKVADELERQLDAEFEAEKFYKSRDLSIIDELENVHDLRKYMAETMGDPHIFINRLDGDLTKEQTKETIHALITKMADLGIVERSSSEHKILKRLLSDFDGATDDNERSLALKKLETEVTDAIYSPNVKIDYNDMSQPWSDPFASVLNKNDFVELILKGRLNDLLEPDDFADKTSSRLRTVERMAKYGMIEEGSKEHTAMIDSVYSISEGKFADLCKNTVINAQKGSSSNLRAIQNIEESPSQNGVQDTPKGSSSIIYQRTPSPVIE